MTQSLVNPRNRPQVAGERADVAHLGYGAEMQRRATADTAPWLPALRARALERFNHLGLPTQRSEDWRYTNLAPLSKTVWPPAEVQPAGPVQPLADFEASTLRLVNGRVMSRLDQLPEGLHITTLADAGDLSDDLLRPDDHALMALNAALVADLLVVSVDRNTAIELPLVIDHRADAAPEQSVQSRLILRLEPGAALTVVERYHGGGADAHWINPVRRIEVADNAHLKLVTLVHEADTALHTGTVTAELGRTARFDGWALIDGGRTVRHEMRVAFRGEGGEARLKGATLGASGQNLAVYTAIDHAVPHCMSDQVFRSVVDQGGGTAFQGRILVQEGAQKTDAAQSSRNLLLDKGAEANTKPELEIYADDVKCAHGATVGELDADQLFYLEARGIAPAVARAMLVEAFVAGVIEDAPVPALADYLCETVARWMHDRGDKL